MGRCPYLVAMASFKYLFTTQLLLSLFLSPKYPDITTPIIYHQYKSKLVSHLISESYIKLQASI